MARMFTLLAFLLCASSPALAAPGDVHLYHASVGGVNSYYVETNRGVVVIDTQLLISETKQLKAAIDKLGKPVIGIIITSPRPEHYNGIAILGADRAKLDVFATRATIERITATHKEQRKRLQPVYRNDYPDTTLIPNRAIKSGDTLKYDGLQLRLEELIDASPETVTMVHHPARRTLFPSDLVANRVHTNLTARSSSASLAQLGRLLQNYADLATVHPGYGEGGTLMTVNRQIDYLNTLQILVRVEVEKQGKFTDLARETIKREMIRRYPDYANVMVLDESIDAVKRELTGTK